MDVKLEKVNENNFDDFVEIIEKMCEWAGKELLGDDGRLRLKKHYFQDKPKFNAILAFIDDKPVGFVSFFETYATMDARVTMYVEDIFVLEEFQKQGIGKVLISECLNIAKEKDYGRVDLLSFREGPRKFYEKLGAKWQDHNYHYRFFEDVIKAGF
ncbi:MAG: GNAT family N-acetyltransferase [Patescibacteria group bacterium]|nr:GNAT family N-acetyltransferase [Patescibacteria group bacterium]